MHIYLYDSVIIVCKWVEHGELAKKKKKKKPVVLIT